MQGTSRHGRHPSCCTESAASPPRQHARAMVVSFQEPFRLQCKGSAAKYTGYRELQEQAYRTSIIMAEKYACLGLDMFRCSSVELQMPNVLYDEVGRQDAIHHSVACRREQQVTA